jgi:hypothetical protein
MHFVVASAEQKWWGGCAWDSFGIMAALDQRCWWPPPAVGCGRPLALLADPQAPPPEPYVAHFLVPAPAGGTTWSGPARPSAWPATPEHVEAWAAEAASRVGAVVDLATMWRLGKVWYADRLHDDHRRRTPRRRPPSSPSRG